jgi:hypothetical protein
MKTIVIFLYVLVDRGGSSQEHRFPHPSYESCFAALREMKIQTGGHTDEVAIAWCGPPGEMYGHNYAWFKDRYAE